jgi:glyoxylase-like metal-dependent hydrolase (beta-lactamase superfamily II)
VDKEFMPLSEPVILQGEIDEFHLLDTGFCYAWEHTLISTGRWKRIKCHSTVGLLHHTLLGWILWDTGFAPRIIEATRPWSYRLYRLATPMRLSPALTALQQILDLGLTAKDIRFIVISHLHGDHIAGLRDFPESRFILAKSGWDYFEPRSGFNAVRKGYLPSLIPEDFSERAELLPEFSGPEIGALGASHDLFGDGSVQLVSLPGHARGQMGMLALVQGKRYLFTADACLHSESLRSGRSPGMESYLVADSIADISRSISKLSRFCRENPDVIPIPTHCPEVFESFVVRKNDS